MESQKSDKIERVLGIYTKLMNGLIVNKAEESRNYGVNERSIQRDIDDIRNYLDINCEKSAQINSVIYDCRDKGYRLEQKLKMKFSNSEILAICKILLDSRAFSKKQMAEMMEKLISCCVEKSNQRIINELIKNESFHYVEPRHKTDFIDSIWEIGQAIKENRYIEIDYTRLKDKNIVRRKLKPVAIILSEYYFYITAFIENKETSKNFDIINDPFPTIYRIDRINNEGKNNRTKVIIKNTGGEN